MTKLFKYIVFLGLVGGSLAGCRDFSFSSFMRGEPIASVGDQKLYIEDVQALFTPGILPEDSLKLLHSYVDLWVKQQLKIREAEKAFPEEEERITRMVNDYRNSLLLYEYEKAYLDSRLDTAVTRSEIDEFYAAHKGDFLLSSPLVKGFVIRFPQGFRQEGQMRIMAMSGHPERLQDLADIALKNNFAYREFDRWVEASEMTAFLPRIGEPEVQRMLAASPLYEFTSGGMRYLVVVTDIIREGSPTPPERASETIRTMIVTRRKMELLRNLDDSLYRHALAAKEAVVLVDTLRPAMVKQDTVTAVKQLQ